jgi:hypothetical protein
MGALLHVTIMVDYTAVAGVTFVLALSAFVFAAHFEIAVSVGAIEK